MLHIAVAGLLRLTVCLLVVASGGHGIVSIPQLHEFAPAPSRELRLFLSLDASWKAVALPEMSNG